MNKTPFGNYHYILLQHVGEDEHGEPSYEAEYIYDEGELEIARRYFSDDYEFDFCDNRLIQRDANTGVLRDITEDFTESAEDWAEEDRQEAAEDYQEECELRSPYLTGRI